MMGTSQGALFLIPMPGKGSTLLRGSSTSAPELSSSAALAPLLKGFWSSEELIVHPNLEVLIEHFQLGEAPANQTKPVLKIHDVSKFQPQLISI